MATNQACCNVVVDDSKADYNYVYYFLKTQYNQLRNLSSGVRNNLNSNDIKDYEITIPNKISTQKQIADVLSVLDDKIAVNNKINIELEGIANTLYNYWFVQFNFPDANGQPYKSSSGKMIYNAELKREIPEGWSVRPINYFIQTDKNGDWGKEECEGNYNLRVECIRGTDINGLNGNGEAKCPIRFILEKNESKLLKPYDIVIEISGGSPSQSTGRLGYITEELLQRFSNPLICSNFCKAITLNNNSSFYYFIYTWNRLYGNNILFGFEGKTSGIKNLLFETFISNYRVIVPDEKLQKRFADIINNFEKQKQINLKQNQILTSLRDWLLPMLMNGQITVKEAYQQVAEKLSMVAEPTVEYVYKKKPTTPYDNYYKIQILYTTIWANKSINVKQGEMATAKDVYLLDKIYGVKSDFQFAQHNWGSFDPKEKQLLNTKQYFHKPNFPNSKAFYLDLKDEGKLLEKIPESLKNQISQGISEMDAKVFHKYGGTKKSEMKELYATILMCIEENQSQDFSTIREAMNQWEITQQGKKMTKADKFSEVETQEALNIILQEGWEKNVLSI